MRHLSREVVKAQCGDQADDPFRYSFGSLRQTVMLRRLCVRRNVETASHSHYQTSIRGELQVLARYSSTIQVAGSEDTPPANHPCHKVELRGRHWLSLQYVVIYIQVQTYCQR